MKAQKFRKYIVRSIVAIMTASLVTSCAYDNSYGENYPSNNSNRGTGDSFAPLLIGAAAIGAIALAKRHNDKKRDHRNDHYRNHGNHHYNHRRPNYNHRNNSYRNGDSNCNNNRYNGNYY